MIVKVLGPFGNWLGHTSDEYKIDEDTDHLDIVGSGKTIETYRRWETVVLANKPHLPVDQVGSEHLDRLRRDAAEVLTYLLEMITKRERFRAVKETNPEETWLDRQIEPQLSVSSPSRRHTPSLALTSEPTAQPDGPRRPLAEAHLSRT